jgi:hypothetical protein
MGKIHRLSTVPDSQETYGPTDIGSMNDTRSKPGTPGQAQPPRIVMTPDLARALMQWAFDDHDPAAGARPEGGAPGQSWPSAARPTHQRPS